MSKMIADLRTDLLRRIQAQPRGFLTRVARRVGMHPQHVGRTLRASPSPAEQTLAKIAAAVAAMERKSK